jgi:hypothetical protein
LASKRMVYCGQQVLAMSGLHAEMPISDLILGSEFNADSRTGRRKFQSDASHDQ